VEIFGGLRLQAGMEIATSLCAGVRERSIHTNAANNANDALAQAVRLLHEQDAPAPQPRPAAALAVLGLPGLHRRAGTAAIANIGLDDSSAGAGECDLSGVGMVVEKARIEEQDCAPSARL